MVKWCSTQDGRTAYVSGEPKGVVEPVGPTYGDAGDVIAHRAPALVIGPYVKRGGEVIHHHYDQLSVIRTIELILGIEPLSLYDANAVPMYDVFTPKPDNGGYVAIKPEVNQMLVNAGGPPSAKLSARLTFDSVDAVPQELSDYILYKAVYGERFTPPPVGPRASLVEHRRALEAFGALRRGEDPSGQLLRGSADDDD